MKIIAGLDQSYQGDVVFSPGYFRWIFTSRARARIGKNGQGNRNGGMSRNC